MVQKSGTRINMGSRKRKEKMHENLSKSLLSINQPQQQHTQKRFMGVRQSQSGRWVAEIKGTAQKIRLWLGTFDTPEEAAHAYDEAACLLRGADTRTNFWPRTTSGFGEPTGRSCSSSVLSAKVLNQLLDHLKTQRAAKSPQSSLSLPLKPSLLSPPQHQQQHQHQHQQHNHKQELELKTCDVSTCGATTHCVDEKYCRGNDYNNHDEMKNKVEVEKDVSLDMDLKLEDFSYFFAPFETEGKRRVEIGTYEYWSMLFAAAKGV